MKRKLLFASVLGVLSFNLEAQITINSGDVVGFGDRVINAIDLTSSTSIGGSGANQTWNFSSLTTDETDTMDFTNPTWYGLNNPFGAQMVMISSREDSSFTYLTKTSTELTVNGVKQILANGDTVDIAFNSTIIPFPATYGMSGTWSGSFEILRVAVGVDPDGPGPHATVDSIMFTRYTDASTSVDAWGDVTTPLGTFASLRQNSIENNVDTTWMYTNGQWSILSQTASLVFQIPPVSYDTTRTVRWWSNDPSARFPVVEFQYDQNGNSNGEISWLKASPTTSIKEVSSFNLTLYPNPSNGNINIKSDAEIAWVKIYDITGKVMSKYRFTNKKNITINTNLPKGFYVVEITNKSGDNIIQKLMIQ